MIRNTGNYAEDSNTQEDAPEEKGKWRERACAKDFTAYLDVINAELPHALKMEVRRRHLDISEGVQADIQQQVLIRMWQNDLAKFDPEKSSLTTFMKRRMQWEVNSFLRKRSRPSTAYPVEGIEELADKHLPPPRSPEEQLQFEERERLLLEVPELMERATEALPQEEIDAIMMPLAGAGLTDVARKYHRHQSSAGRYRKRALNVIRRRHSEEDLLALGFHCDDWMDLA